MCLSNLDNDYNEIITLKNKSNIICGIYRPFKCYDQETQWSNFERLLENLELVTNSFGKRHSKLVVGDFNIRLDMHNCKMKIAADQWAEDSDLAQFVNFDTRSRMVNGILQRSMIDHVYSNVDTLDVGGDFNDYSDHLIISIKDKAYKSCAEQKKRISYLDWRKYSKEGVRQEFIKHFGGINIYVASPDIILDRIASAIVHSLNTLVPKRESTIRGSCPVINPVIQNLKNRKIRAYKNWSKNKTDTAWVALKEISKKLNSEIRRERSRSLRSCLDRSSKDFWATTNKLMGKKSKNHIELEVDGLTISKDDTIAEVFSEFFCKKIDDLDKACNYVSNSVTISDIYGFLLRGG